MSRPLFGIVGALLVLAPEWIVRAYESAAIVNPDDIQRSPSFVPAARVEGIMFLVVTAIGGKPYSWMMNVFGVGGALAVVFPKQTTKFGAKVTYENPDTIQWNPTFFDVVRGLGLLYIGLAIRAYRRGRSEGSPTDHPSD